VAFFNILLVTRAGSPASVDRGHHRRGARQPRKTEHRHDQSPQHAEPRRGTLHQHGPASKSAIVPFRTSPDMASAVIRGDVDVAFEFFRPGASCRREAGGNRLRRADASRLSAQRSDRHRKRPQRPRSDQLAGCPRPPATNRVWRCRPCRSPLPIWRYRAPPRAVRKPLSRDLCHHSRTSQ
jgi:hypothetical protein